MVARNSPKPANSASSRARRAASPRCGPVNGELYSAGSDHSAVIRSTSRALTAALAAAAPRHNGALGVAAVVIDGAVRDSEAIRALGFPMFAAGLNPNGPTKFVPGRLNHPISVGGVTVCPGDLVVDVGANVGNHAIYLAAVAGCTVAAFEPNPELCAAMRESAVLNGRRLSGTLVDFGIDAGHDAQQG